MTQPTPPCRSSKRLLFDRRYGWVLDEWKEPSEEALAGGRGMFCILPLTKTLLKIASDSINAAAVFALRAIEDPKQLLSVQAMRTNLSSRCGKLIQLAQRPDMKLLASRRDSARPTV